MRWLALSLVLMSISCGSGDRSEEAQEMVRQAFAAQNVPGRVGTEVLGKGVWFRAPALDSTCLPKKDLAFRDDIRRRPDSNKGAPRMSPLYTAQRFFTYSTKGGYCVYLGDDLTMQIGDVEHVADDYFVGVRYNISNRTPWWDCADPHLLDRQIRVVDKNGQLEIIGDVTLHRGACPGPLPGGEERDGRARPSGKAPKAPTKQDAIAAAKRFDDALWNQDYLAARDALACYNLFEKKNPFGACSVAELVGLGPIPRGDLREQDGPPWTDYAFDSFDEFGRIEADRKDKTLFHVNIKDKRSGRDRSLSVQWVGGQWKLVGMVSLQGEGLTNVRVMYDLHRRDKRDIWERRMAGEEIDDKGEPLDPRVRFGYAEEDEEEEE